jgi:predicted amidohydrolase
VKVALVQHDVVFEDAEATLARLGPRVEEAAASGARLIVLTEMFATGFSMATSRVAEPPGGPSTEFLLDKAASTKAVVAGSLPIKEPGAARPVNRFLFAFPDGTTLSYDKVHPFSFGEEDRHYQAGSKVVTFLLEGIALTPFVCYDLRFADLFWDAALRSDAFVLVANWPAARQSHFRTLAIARAIENQAYVLATNRVGTGGGIDYAGGSIAIAPFGEVLAEAGESEETLFVELEAARVREVRERYGFLADRRVVPHERKGAPAQAAQGR